MPFDATPQDDAPVETIGTQRIRALIDALEGKMPEGFRFDFTVAYVESSCGTIGCAMGLARTIWPEFDEACARESHMLATERWFAMSPPAVNDIFFNTELVYADDRVGPRDVATVLRQYVDDFDLYMDGLRHRMDCVW